MERLTDFTRGYTNDKEHNEQFYNAFTELTNKISFLKEHRDHIEKNKLGFGDRAFHFMWFLILQDLSVRFPEPELLEIGVYKGQVISLWAVISGKLNFQSSITAVSPLEGNFPKSRFINNRYVRRLLRILNKRYRKDVSVGNHYLKEDYKVIIESLFRTFGQDFSRVKMHKGFSSDPTIVDDLKRRKFHLIYIDGDHSYEGALFDIRTYGPLVEPGGYLVMDDASYYLPGTNFWKGHEEVSRACEIIESLGFNNVLNIGHNRVYQKINS